MSAADQDIRTALLDAARALGPMIRSAADQIEQERQLPQPLVNSLAEAGLFKMLVPRALGGGEVNPETCMRVIEEVARADGSAGWCVMLPACCGVAAGSLPEAVAWEIWGRDRLAYVAGSARLDGRAVTVADGYRVRGRWAFGSGCMHATWLLAVAAVYDGETPRLNPNGTPASRIVFLPAADCRIIDTWRVGGLRGSGSHDYAIDDVFVPEERTLARTAPPQRPRHPGALYTFGIGVLPSGISASPGVPPWAAFGPLGFAAVSLGIARGALDAFADLAGSKAPRGGKALLRDDPVVQAQVGQAEATLRAARAFTYGTVRESWESVCRGDASTAEQQNMQRLASTHAAVLSAQVVETVWKLAGASSIFLSSPLERRFRDVFVAAQNVAVSPEYYGVAGRLSLGVGQ